jgi:hypothetical protein
MRRFAQLSSEEAADLAARATLDAVRANLVAKVGSKEKADKLLRGAKRRVGDIAKHNFKVDDAAFARSWFDQKTETQNGASRVEESEMEREYLEQQWPGSAEEIMEATKNLGSEEAIWKAAYIAFEIGQQLGKRNEEAQWMSAFDKKSRIRRFVLVLYSKIPPSEDLNEEETWEWLDRKTGELLKVVSFGNGDDQWYKNDQAIDYDPLPKSCGEFKGEFSEGLDVGSSFSISIEHPNYSNLRGRS